MKHLKKLSVVLMMTILFSVSFTSCIDNEVSPVVEAIYEAQANLLAAQARVQDAEATLRLAQAQATQAQAAYTTAQTAQVAAYTAGVIANNAYTAAQRQQYLLQLVAETNLSVATAQNALALAQVNFQTQLAAAIATMKAAGATVAVGYANQYRIAMLDANNILSDKLSAEASLAQAMLMQTGGVSWTYFLAQLQGNVTVAQANKADIQAAITAMTAYIANPSTPEAIISGLKAANIALQTQIDAKDVALQVQYNKIQAIYNENGVRDELVDQYNAAKADLNFAIAQKQHHLGLITTAQTSIAAKQVLLAAYPAALLAATNAKTAAELAVTNAKTALGVKQGTLSEITSGYYAKDAGLTLNIAAGGTKYLAPANLQEVYVNARITKLNADATLLTVQTEITALYGALQNAINTLAAQQAIYDGGIAGVTLAVTNATTAVTNATTALATAQAYYMAKRTIFEAAPAGLTWFDQTTPLGGSTAETSAFPNTKIGNHADAIATSYAYVTAWVEAPVGTWTPTALSLTTVAAMPGTATAYTAPVVSATQPSVLATTGYYVEVEADDLSETNAALLNDAVAKLGDSNIFNTPPALPPTYPIAPVVYLAGTDANTVLYNAQLTLLAAQDDLAKFGVNLATALTAYNYQKNLYDNELTILAAAQATALAATSAQTTAKANVDAAWLALGTSSGTPTFTSTKITVTLPATLKLYDVQWNAQINLAILVNCNAACIQDSINVLLADIAGWNADIAAINPIITALQAVVASLQVRYDAYIASEGYLSGLYADLEARLIAEYQAYWVLEQEKVALENTMYLNEELINAYGWGADDLDTLKAALANLKLDLVAANLQIELATQALATATVSKNYDQALIAYYQAQVTTLSQRYANALAIAAKWKALMDAALAA